MLLAVVVLLHAAAGFEVQRPARPLLKFTQVKHRQCSDLLKLSADSDAQHEPGRTPPISAPDKRTQLQWLVNSAEKLWISETGASNDSAESENSLLVALRQLAAAQTPQQVYEAGRVLEQASFQQQWNHEGSELKVPASTVLALQERVIKAAAMTGLIQLALNATQTHLFDKQVLPSDIVQNALVSALRKAGRYDELEQLLLQLGDVWRKNGLRDQQPSSSDEIVSQGVSLFAFNMYLASLSEDRSSMDNHRNRRKKSVPPQQRRLKKKASGALLQRGLDWTLTGRAQAELGVEPDAVSYATLLQAAFKEGNRTASDQLWQHVCDSDIPKTVHTYNARLKALLLLPSSRGVMEKDDAAAMAIWDEMTAADSASANQYTIDLMLLPWERQRQRDGSSWSRIESVLDKFCFQPNLSKKKVSDAFGSFLLRLTSPPLSSLEVARSIFDKYVASRFQPVIVLDARSGNNSTFTSVSRVVEPQTRHFNIILEGYRKALRDCRDKDVRIQRSEEAWDLFRTMLRNSARASVGPDTITFTTMMGICTTSLELCQLLNLPASVVATNQKNRRTHSRSTNESDENEPAKTTCMGMMTQNNALLRAAITRFGELGDVSSACWMFAEYGLTPHQMKQPKRQQLRLWNVLLNAIAKTVALSSKQKQRKATTERVLVNMTHAPAYLAFTDERNQAEHCAAASAETRWFVDELDGSNCADAAETVLSFMLALPGGAAVMISAPRPDSQSFCLVASALQHSHDESPAPLHSDRILQLFRQARELGIPADGRFVNALLRCYGGNVQDALEAWKQDIRPACTAHEHRPNHIVKGKNLLAAYHGLFYCCGRALRPDLAVRLAHAMQKVEELEPNEASLHSYHAGKRERLYIEKEEQARRQEAADPSLDGIPGEPKEPSFLAKVMAVGRRRPSSPLVAPYESLLYIECTKYDQNDRRRLQEKRVRIIV